MNTHQATAPTYIRRVVAADESEFVKAMKSSRELHDPWITPPTSGMLFKYYMDRLSTHDHEGLVICRQSDDAIIGVVNINNIVRGSFLSASLGYYVVADFQGKGYMKNGLQLVVKYAFNTLGLHRLEANIQPENERSKKLVSRCGFELEGLSRDFLFINGKWRDHERWCLVDRRKGLRAGAT